LWRDNQASLKPLEEQSFLLKEVIPASEALSGLGEAGLQAMDYLDRGEHPSEDWTTQQLAFIQQAEQPKAQLLIMVAPWIEKLVKASSGMDAAPK
jgi:aspartate-semialdehyde dehydrogenase